MRFSHRYMVSYTSQNAFITVDGRKLYSLHELTFALTLMDETIFSQHVTSHKNDFAKWVNDTLHLPILARAMHHERNKASLISLLEHFLQHDSLPSEQNVGDLRESQQKVIHDLHQLQHNVSQLVDSGIVTINANITQALQSIRQPMRIEDFVAHLSASQQQLLDTVTQRLESHSDTTIKSISQTVSHTSQLTKELADSLRTLQSNIANQVSHSIELSLQRIETNQKNNNIFSQEKIQEFANHVKQLITSEISIDTSQIERIGFEVETVKQSIDSFSKSVSLISSQNQKTNDLVSTVLHDQQSLNIQNTQTQKQITASLKDTVEQIQLQKNQLAKTIHSVTENMLEEFKVKLPSLLHSSIYEKNLKHLSDAVKNQLSQTVDEVLENSNKYVSISHTITDQLEKITQQITSRESKIQSSLDHQTLKLNESQDSLKQVVSQLESAISSSKESFKSDQLHSIINRAIEIAISKSLSDSLSTHAKDIFTKLEVFQKDSSADHTAMSQMIKNSSFVLDSIQTDVHAIVEPIDKVVSLLHSQKNSSDFHKLQLERLQNDVSALRNDLHADISESFRSLMSQSLSVDMAHEFVQSVANNLNQKVASVSSSITIDDESIKNILNDAVKESHRKTFDIFSVKLQDKITEIIETQKAIQSDAKISMKDVRLDIASQKKDIQTNHNSLLSTLEKYLSHIEETIRENDIGLQRHLSSYLQDEFKNQTIISQTHFDTTQSYLNDISKQLKNQKDSSIQITPILKALESSDAKITKQLSQNSQLIQSQLKKDFSDLSDSQLKNIVSQIQLEFNTRESNAKKTTDTIVQSLNSIQKSISQSSVPDIRPVEKQVSRLGDLNQKIIDAQNSNVKQIITALQQNQAQVLDSQNDLSKLVENQLSLIKNDMTSITQRLSDDTIDQIQRFSQINNDSNTTVQKELQSWFKVLHKSVQSIDTKSLKSTEKHILNSIALNKRLSEEQKNNILSLRDDVLSQTTKNTQILHNALDAQTITLKNDVESSAEHLQLLISTLSEKFTQLNSNVAQRKDVTKVTSDISHILDKINEYNLFSVQSNETVQAKLEDLTAAIDDYFRFNFKDREENLEELSLFLEQKLRSYHDSVIHAVQKASSVKETEKALQKHLSHAKLDGKFAHLKAAVDGTEDTIIRSIGVSQKKVLDTIYPDVEFMKDVIVQLQNKMESYESFHQEIPALIASQLQSLLDSSVSSENAKQFTNHIEEKILKIIDTSFQKNNSGFSEIFSRLEQIEKSQKEMHLSFVDSHSKQSKTVIDQIDDKINQLLESQVQVQKNMENSVHNMYHELLERLERFEKTQLKEESELSSQVIALRDTLSNETKNLIKLIHSSQLNTQKDSQNIMVRLIQLESSKNDTVSKNFDTTLQNFIQSQNKVICDIQSSIQNTKKDLLKEIESNNKSHSSKEKNILDEMDSLQNSLKKEADKVSQQLQSSQNLYQKELSTITKRMSQIEHIDTNFKKMESEMSEHIKNNSNMKIINEQTKVLVKLQTDMVSLQTQLSQIASFLSSLDIPQSKTFSLKSTSSRLSDQIREL